MKKNVKIIIGSVGSLLGVAILISILYFLIFTEKIILDSMPAPDIQEQIDIYAELGYCMGGFDNGEDIEIWLTRHQRQKWMQDVQEDIKLYLEETNGLDNMVFEISKDKKKLTLIANENMSFKSAATYVTAFVYNMQLYQVLNGEKDWKIYFILKDLATGEVLYTVEHPDNNIRVEQEMWD